MSGGFNFNPVNLVTQIGLAALTGGASLAVTMATQAVVSSIGQQIIQGLGQALGMPQSVIDMAQGAFASSLGDVQGAQQNWQEAVENFGEMVGLNTFDQAKLSNQVSDYIDDLIRDLAQDFAESGGAEEGSSGGGRTGAQRSWLQALAEIMGKKLNQLAVEFTEKADALDWDDPAEATKFQAVSQEFKLMFESIATAVKTAGEGMSAAARKQ